MKLFIFAFASLSLLVSAVAHSQDFPRLERNILPLERNSAREPRDLSYMALLDNSQSNSPESIGLNICQAAHIVFKCADGNTDIVPGCSVSCPETKAAVCYQGSPLIATCSFSGPSCECK